MICTAMLLFGQAYAQTGPPAGFDPKESFEQFMADCTRELNLTNEQESKMRSILEEQFAEQKAYREKMKGSGSKDFRAMKKEMEGIRKKTDTQLKTFLDDEQMKKFVLAGLETMARDGYVAVHQAGADTQIMRAFEELEVLDVDPREPFAANALRVGEAVLHPAVHGETRRRLRQRGLNVVPVELSELAKAEGGVTCCSLLLEVP